jgi:hypothetical protein
MGVIAVTSFLINPMIGLSISRPPGFRALSQMFLFFPARRSRGVYSFSEVRPVECTHVTAIS